MVSKQEQRSEDTRKSIVAAAGKLFSSKGYDAVTMREIAKEAGCSHTTIYIYFKDKEALLYQLSKSPLLALMQQMEALLVELESAEDKLKSVSLAFISFCLSNRNMYDLFFNVKAGRVDEKAPEMEINQIRNRMFGLLSKAVGECLHLQLDDERQLLSTRIYFFALNGILSTYAYSEESSEQLLERLTPIFQQTFEVVLAGLKHSNSSKSSPK